jgi:glycosyltransferase involved in cell wall biosynthesis
MKVLIITNIPSPYRIDFFNEFGKHVDLTVVFEAKQANGITFNWNLDEILNFKVEFLKNGYISEKRINLSILKFIIRPSYDHIIMTNYAYYTEMVALIALKMQKIQYFLEIDGGFVRNELKARKIFKTFLIKGAKGYFSPSKASDEYLIHYGADKGIIYRYPFTSLKEEDVINKYDIDKIALKKKLKINDKFIVLSVGRFIHIKGFDVLLKASRNFHKEIALYIIGGIPDDDYLEIVEKYNLKNVHFVDFISKSNLEYYYSIADVFVFPSRGDVWGLVVNEAMAKGLPIITTDKSIAGLELVENDINGYVIPVENENLISFYVNKLFYNEDLKQLLSKNSLYRIKTYTIESMVDAHLKALKVLTHVL